MSLQLIHGKMLASCRFSKSGATLEFVGKINGEHRSLMLATSYSVSSSLDETQASDRQISEIVWPMLERDVQNTAVEVTSLRQRVIIGFGQGLALVVTGYEPLQHELFLLSIRETGEWFTLP